MTALADSADNAAASAGFNPALYAHKVYIFPKNSCTWAGMVMGGNNPSRAWINGNLNLKAVGHEIGHNFGLLHAHGLDCGQTVIGTTCTSYDYYDIADIMGGNPGHFNAFHKEQLAWLNTAVSPPISTIETSGTYVLEPYETQTANPKALKILKSADPTTGAKTWYYVEYRQPVGFDSVLSSIGNAVKGLLIHTGTDGDLSSSQLLDTTPNSNTTYPVLDQQDSALAAGSSFTDSTAGITIVADWVNASGASVSVDIAKAACARNKPALTISPQSQIGSTGASLSYTLSVTNNDDPTCASSATYNLSATPPSGWGAGFANASLPVNAGSTASTTLNLTSASSATTGSYSAGITAASGSYSGSASATYSVISSLSVATITDKSSYSRGQTVTIKSTVKGGTTPVSGAGVMFTVTKANGSVVSQNATTNATGTASITIKLTKRDPTGSYGVKSQASLQTLSGTAQTSFTVM